jgi:hypothetical protein
MERAISGPGRVVSVVNTSQGLPEIDAEQTLAALLSENPFVLILVMSTATRFRLADSVAEVGQVRHFLRDRLHA